MAKNKKQVSGDRIIAVLAVVVMVAFIFMQRTGGSVVFAAFIIFVVGIHTVTHSPYVVESKRRQRLAGAGWFAVVLAWTMYSWPHEMPPSSDIRIEEEYLSPFNAQEQPTINRKIRNDSAYEIRYRELSLVAVSQGLPSLESLKFGERDLWTKLAAKVEAVEESPDDSNFYPIGLPPKVITLNSLRGESLTQQQADDLKAGNGNTAVFFMSVFIYEDYFGVHGLEYCEFTQGKSMVRCLNGHNGPVRIKGPRRSWWQKLL
jgi:hypothetical protein